MTEASNNEFKIESRSYYRKIEGSRSSGSDGMINHVQISLPKLKFLEPDGVPYKPAWAVHKPETVPKITPADAPKRIEKNAYGPRSFNLGQTDITDLEKRVYEMHAEGMSKEKICEILEMRASSVGGALVRYQKKMLARGEDVK
jgi:DNA-binding CsgD family transcriptional regulator